jgi:hypothetical protein
MSLLTIMQDAAVLLGLAKPSVVASSPELTYQQMLVVANQVLQDLKERHAWSTLQKVATFTGDGVNATLTLPSDFDRPCEHPFASRPLAPDYFWPAGPLSSPEWAKATTYLTTAIVPVFRRRGLQLEFFPTPAVGETFNVAYQSANCVNVGGLEQPRFVADADIPVFDENLVMQGVLYMWKRIKGFDYAQEMDDYERSFERIASYDAGLMPTRTANMMLDRSGLGDVRVVT